jgi:hypothetical protein
MPLINGKEQPRQAGKSKTINFTRPTVNRRSWWAITLAIAAACVFVFLASYRIGLPGLYMDEVDFVSAARGAPDDTMVHMRLGPIPLLIMPYLGALKAWLYAPVFWLFGVSALTIRLPAILLAALTLLILFHLMQSHIGAVWATIAVWLMAIDPANLFTSRLDWGPTVLMHFFAAVIFALWLSYRDKPKLWKIILIFGCAGLGFFDKFNFIWVVLAFLVAVCLCHSDSLKHFWISSPKSTRWVTFVLCFLGLSVALLMILWVLHRYAGAPLELGLQSKWGGLLSTLSGAGIASFLFGNNTGIITFIPFWLIVTDCYLALACLFFLSHNAEQEENRKDGLFFLLIGFLVFAQIVITPQAGGPHHYVMIFPLPLLAFVFLAQPAYRRISANALRQFAAVLLVSAAACVFFVNAHNTLWYLSRFRTNSQYNPRWSPAIYSLSDYINEHGRDVHSIISIDWGLHNQLHALAPRELQPLLHDYWPTFKELKNEDQASEATALNTVIPEGKNLVVTFAASKETFPETRRNFLAAMANHPELKCRLLKQFWHGGQKIYEVYEIDRPPHGATIRQVAPQNSLIYLTKRRATALCHITRTVVALGNDWQISSVLSSDIANSVYIAE